MLYFRTSAEICLFGPDALSSQFYHFFLSLFIKCISEDSVKFFVCIISSNLLSRVFMYLLVSEMSSQEGMVIFFTFKTKNCFVLFKKKWKAFPPESGSNPGESRCVWGAQHTLC